MTSQEVTTVAATTATVAEDATAVTQAARIEHVSTSFSAPGTPGGQQLVPDGITPDVAPGEFVTSWGLGLTAGPPPYT
jgi:NitT/TauT family transport system ATP-binding protein